MTKEELEVPCADCGSEICPENCTHKLTDDKRKLLTYREESAMEVLQAIRERTHRLNQLHYTSGLYQGIMLGLIIAALIMVICIKVCLPKPMHVIDQTVPTTLPKLEKVNIS